MSYNGKILHVNLTEGILKVEQPDERFYRTYFGGRNFIAYYLLKGLKPGADALGPENRLIFATGIVTGVPVPGTGRNSVGAKSPLTGGYAEAEAGGYFGAELKRAGFDAIVVDGKAEEPVYLWIRDGEACLRAAGHLWGRDTGEAEDLIREELGDQRVRTALIGPAGENLVRVACVMNDRTRAAGRGGLGAVLGSKGLKGVAVRGTRSLSLADPDRLKAIARLVIEKKPGWEDFMDLGTASNVLSLNLLGGLPTQNFQAGSFHGAEKLSAEVMRDTILVDRPTCYACPIHCKREVEVTEGAWKVSRSYGGPEYETIASLGSLCGVDELAAVAKGNELCNRYGLDTISTGSIIAFVMECFERGVLTSERSGGWQIRFGDAGGMVQAVEMIARREGFGDRMAEGVRRLADWIGPHAEPLSLQVKGQEIPMHEPRIKHGLGLGYAVSPTGADHVHNIHDTNYATETGSMEQVRSLGILEPLSVYDLSSRKVRLFVHEVNLASLDNCLVMCANLVVAYGLQERIDIVQASTGWNSSAIELEKVGERSITMARAFNVREGFSRADDHIPERLYASLADSSTGEPLSREVFEQALTTYYSMMGWDATGIPTRWKLQELGIEWIAAELARHQEEP